MAEEKLGAVNEREKITHAWLVEEKAGRYLGRTDISFYDLPRGYQHQVTRENPRLWQLDIEAMKQTLDGDSPMELVEDKLRITRKMWEWGGHEKLAALVIEGNMDGHTYAEESTRVRTEAIAMYGVAGFVALELDAESLGFFRRWKRLHTHPWDKALDQYYSYRQSVAEKAGYKVWESTEAAGDYVLRLLPNVTDYIRWMLLVDWVVDLGPNAQKIEQLRAIGYGARAAKN